MEIVVWTFAAIGAGAVGFSALVVMVAIMAGRAKSRRRATLTPDERRALEVWRASQSPASPAINDTLPPVTPIS